MACLVRYRRGIPRHGTGPLMVERRSAALMAGRGSARRGQPRSGKDWRGKELSAVERLRTALRLGPALRVEPRRGQAREVMARRHRQSRGRRWLYGWACHGSVGPGIVRLGAASVWQGRARSGRMSRGVRPHYGGSGQDKTGPGSAWRGQVGCGMAWLGAHDCRKAIVGHCGQTWRAWARSGDVWNGNTGHVRQGAFAIRKDGGGANGEASSAVASPGEDRMGARYGFGQSWCGRASLGQARRCRFAEVKRRYERRGLASLGDVWCGKSVPGEAGSRVGSEGLTRH